jgi:8-oxo-dGTP pyrophosphatase MutT (NUDIX family)
VNILAEIHRSKGIDTQGKTIYRNAVRGVILRGRNLLMVHSTTVGDYKFPGGGVDAGESHEQALRREIREECGALLIEFGQSLGSVIEYKHPEESDYDVFKMTSHYYLCQVGDGFGAQKLDGYEKDLGFKPVWIDIDESILANRLLLNSDKTPDWLKREIFVLEYIRQNLSDITVLRK